MTITAIGAINIPVLMDISIQDTTTTLPSNGTVQLFMSGTTTAFTPSATDGSTYWRFVIHAQPDLTHYDLHITSTPPTANPISAYVAMTQNGQGIPMHDEANNNVSPEAPIPNLPTGVDLLTVITIDLQ